MKPNLRAVQPTDQPTPEQAWLASYRWEQSALEKIASERALRQSIKPTVMGKMNLWGMSDMMLARELERWVHILSPKSNDRKILAQGGE